MVKRRVILCVDDDKSILDSLEEQILMRFGNEYDCETAESGEEALEIIRELEVENRELMLVMTDQLMPGIKGDELLIRIQASNPTAIKILLTGYTGVQAALNAINNAFLYRYITKPWEENDLLLTIEEAVKSYNQTVQITEYNLYTRLLRSLNKAAREISGEINVNLLIDKFLQIALESTGAEKGLLVLSRDGVNKIEAFSFAGQDKANRFHNYTDEQAAAITTEVMENIEILIEMGIPEGFQIAAPITFKEHRIGYVYLENTLDGQPFNKNHYEILEMLASQAAISLDNAYLYSNLRERTKELEIEKEKVEHVKALLEESNQDVLDSIRYARRIQQAILPPLEELNTIFPHNFVYYVPKDIVSGDFYWWEQVQGYFMVAAADCTGHGVPGAIMAAIGSNALSQIALNDIVNPKCVLDDLHKRIRAMLYKDKQRKEVQDGLDIALLVYHQQTNTIFFAGARRPLWVMRKNNIHEIPGGRFSIGGNLVDDPLVSFKGYQAKVQPGDRIYLFTDGLPDQFGGERQRKFTLKRLKDLLEKNSDLNLNEQQQLIQSQIEDWRGNLTQTDDMLVIGLEIPQL